MKIKNKEVFFRLVILLKFLALTQKNARMAIVVAKFVLITDHSNRAFVARLLKNSTLKFEAAVIRPWSANLNLPRQKCYFASRRLFRKFHGSRFAVLTG